MNDFEKDVSMPVSPMAHYFNSSVLNVFVLGVFESQIPIDDSSRATAWRNASSPQHTLLFYHGKA